ncbi:MAG TPA: sulfatase [Thermoanaerobaculia bacterium]
MIRRLSAVAPLAVGGSLVLSLASCGSDIRETAAAPGSARAACPDCSVILISIDTLRADRLGAYGYHRPTSPHLDALAAEGILFEQCINTGGGTLPVHTSMLTSISPETHGVWPSSNRTLDETYVTLAERLREQGYHTRAYTGGGFVHSAFGLAQGFDEFDDKGGDFEAIFPKLFTWLGSHQGGKFFLFLHTYDVHSDVKRLPYDAPGGFNGKFVDPGYSGSFDGCRGGRCATDYLGWADTELKHKRLRPRDIFSAEETAYVNALYDGGIAYVDRMLGLLFHRLRQLGLYDKTLVVVTADHGEEFFEHGGLLHHTNYEEIARVPLIVRLPGGVHGGRRLPQLVSTLEVMPTVLDAVGIAPPTGIEGHSVVPLFSQDRAGRRLVHMIAGKLRTDRWSLMVDPYEFVPLELYDITRDPYEQKNILAAHPVVARELFQQHEAVRKRQIQRRLPLAGSARSQAPALTDAEVGQLKALGYLR